LGTYITFPELLVWLPFVAGILCFFTGKEKAAKTLAFLASIVVFVVSLTSLCYSDEQYFSYNNVVYYWLKYLGSSIFFSLDGLSRLLTLLTALAYPLIIAATWRRKIKNAPAFFGLMLLAQSGIMGVFTAQDALLFYFFWELALIPVYFLSSKWGDERRIQATFKFFVYTFAGSLLMLVGIIYVYLHTAPRTFSDGTYAAHSFLLSSFYNASLSGAEQTWLFWLFFVGFAIKMPVFPFHSWQPDVYDQAPAPVTMVLSGIMVKMGLYGVLRWLLPVVPLASVKFAHVVMVLSVMGIIYASCIALVQDNLKKLIAFSSIAHIGLMSAAIFSFNELSIKGMMFQMLAHGISVIGMWMVAELLERQVNVRKMSELGGIAKKAPALTIFAVIIGLANLALPLTNSFVGEFMMLSGLFSVSKWYAAIATLSVILVSVYTLKMLQKIFYGNTNAATDHVKDISIDEKVALSIVVVGIIITGVYPQPVFDLTSDVANWILMKLT